MWFQRHLPDRDLSTESHRIHGTSPQITINWWNKQQVSHTLDDLQQMLGKVNMCNYICNLTEEAPNKLYNELKEKQWIN